MKKNNTKKVRRLNGKTLITAVDIGMTTNTGYCRCPDGTEVKPFEFANNTKGFDEFWERVYKAKRANDLEEIVIGFESTASYGEPLMHYLSRKEVKLVQVNPMHTKKLKELTGNSPSKTDNKDPRVIADIIGMGHALTVVIPQGAASELRRLNFARERSMERRTALLNQVHSLIFIIFPEFIRLMKGLGNKTSVYLLNNCTTPQQIIEQGVEALALTMKKISRGNLGLERAEALYMAAQQSAGVREGQKSIVLEILELLSVLQSTERFIEEIEREMERHLGDIPYSRNILSIKGIGIVTAAGIIGEAGDLRAFRTIGEVMKLAGLDLYEISSGAHKGNKRISKRGRHLLRKALYYAAMNTIRKGGVMREFYERYVQKGKPVKKAIIAVARKLLGIVFALVRNQSEFEMNYAKVQNEIKKAA